MTSAWLTATVVYCAVLIRTDWKAECRKATQRNEGDSTGASTAAAGGEEEEQQLQLQDLHSDEVTEDITHDFDSDESETDSEDDEGEEEGEEEPQLSSVVIVDSVAKMRKAKKALQQRISTPDTAPSA